MTKQLRAWVSHPARRSCWLASAVAVPSPTASPISRMASGDLAGDGLQALDSSLVAVDACRHIEAGVQSIVVGQVIGKVSEFHVAGP
jgi:hypothetical protein